MSEIPFALPSLEPWEPEETIGKLWHAFASRLDAPEAHEGAAVGLDEVGGRLAVFFRGLGGGRSVEIRAVEPEASGHRLSLRRRLGTPVERVARASFDGEALRLPARIDAFPEREDNAALYFWLAACAAHAPQPIAETDPLRADLKALVAADAMTRATLHACPGLVALHQRLAGACLAARPRQAAPEQEAPEQEALVEGAIRALLGEETTDRRLLALLAEIRGPAPAFSTLSALRGYRPFRPVALWPELRPLALSAASEADDAPPQGAPDATSDDREGAHRARRREADRPERRDSLILHKFEAILSWAEFLNLNRRVEDEDPDSAKKAADDHDEITLAQISKTPATRLKLHLDLAPEDTERERLSGEHRYPEWDARSQSYLPDHCRVLASDADLSEAPAPFAADSRAQRRIRAVRRQFESLRPRRTILPAQTDGEELDLDAAIRSHADLRASGQGSDRVWRASRPTARDLAVSILLDASRSTESAVTGRAVIDIAREALTALAWGLQACGDDFAIHAFSSLRRDRVFIRRCKGFDDPMGADVESRIAGLRPGFYTRLGAAIRHVSADLALRGQQRRLLLVITDGKPNDLDHYEGRHGVEDSRMAIREARRGGQAVYGVTIDRRSEAWHSRIFGRGGFSVIADPDRLSLALPQIYRQLVGA